MRPCTPIKSPFVIITRSPFSRIWRFCNSSARAGRGSSSACVPDPRSRRSACRSTCSRKAGCRRYGRCCRKGARWLWVVTRGLISPERRTPHSAIGTDEATPPFAISKGGSLKCTGANRCFLPLRLSASQFLDLRLLRTARIVAGLERLFRFALLARRAFGFLAFFFGQLGCICHDSFLIE